MSGKNTHIFFFYFGFKNKRALAGKRGKKRKNSKNLKVVGNLIHINFLIFFHEIKIINFYYPDYCWPEVVRSSCYRNILAQNLLIYVYLHSIRRSSWSTTTLATLVRPSTTFIGQIIWKSNFWLQFLSKYTKILPNSTLTVRNGTNPKNVSPLFQS